MTDEACAISDLDNILKRFGIGASALVGAGAEAQVFALNDASVLRVNRAGTLEADASSRIVLLNRLGSRSNRASFDIPRVRDFGFESGLYFTVEDRLSGIPVSDALVRLAGTGRHRLVHEYLEASLQLGELLSGETEYGELARDGAIRNSCFKTFLRVRAQESLRVRGLRIDVDRIVDAIEEPDQPKLVHLGYCPSNVLCADGRITAVLDFGGTTIAGNSQFNPIIAAAFLNPSITPAAGEKDQLQARGWLRERGLLETGFMVQKWLAAYWSFCGEDEDLPLYHWCLDILQTH
ncbi:MAG: aminoglycoside phosphotransferase family protein [Alphaproteobacteria bacterium]|nr:aminoglycoside phosphotransferase family protein [Alphaproteobacteria bacterium]